MIWQGLSHLHKIRLLSLYTTSRTFEGQTLHITLVEVLLYIVLAMVLAGSCQLEDTWCRCYFVLRGEICFVEAVVGDTAVAEALALWAHVPDDEIALLLITAPPELLFLVRSVARRSGLSWPLPFFWPSAPA
jgi:hypothetical protein